MTAISEQPTRIGGYRVVRKLGEGGMGVVYAAVDEKLDRQVAVKTIRDQEAGAVARDRLSREARAAAALSHLHICQLYDVGEADGELFLVMELLDGESLADRLRAGPLSPQDAVALLGPMLDALHALHERGIVHRDLKLSNVFLTSYGVKLLDFGLAREMVDSWSETAADLTMAGQVVGTPAYMAPEQLLGEPVDARTDLFAVGVLLFEMLAGRSPFAASSNMATMHVVLHDRPPALTGSASVEAADRVIPPDPDTEVLAVGLADALTGSLSTLDSLVVRSPLATTGVDHSDLKTLAASLEVDAVVTATLMRAGDQLCVSAQLVEAPAGTVRWSHRSQIGLGDLFALQDEITRRIVESLSVPLTGVEEQALEQDRPTSARAYEHYLRASRYANSHQTGVQARDPYKQFLELDPGFAPAWARLGRIYRRIGNWGPRGALADNFTESEAALRRALELNPDLSLAHHFYAYLELDLGRAEEAMCRLAERVRRHRDDPELLAGLLHALREDRTQSVIDELERRTTNGDGVRGRAGIESGLPRRAPSGRGRVRRAFRLAYRRCSGPGEPVLHGSDGLLYGRHRAHPCDARTGGEWRMVLRRDDRRRAMAGTGSLGGAVRRGGRGCQGAPREGPVGVRARREAEAPRSLNGG